ncbi:hypothetical protein POW18_22715, partial [Enterobacter roggenkampii]|uniref:hypothetical protein n=1 Tax=Enterobacter roggenkampii TaxID=1812935 RepID=UPI002FF7782D
KACVLPENPASYRVVRKKSYLFNKAAYCLKTQPATGETYPKSDLFNKASFLLKINYSDLFSIDLMR